MKTTKFMVTTLVLFLCGKVHAIDMAQNFNFDGYLTDSAGDPITSSANVTFQIYNPSENCLLFEENHSSLGLDSNGGFSVKIGSGIRASSSVDGGKTLKQIFSNDAQVRSTGTNCSSGYTPAAGDVRKLRVTVNGTVLSPSYSLSPVPMATVAETLQGVPAEGFLKLNSGALQTMSGILKIDTELRLGAGGGNYVGIAAYPGTPSYSFTLPNTQPSNGQVMVSDGAGGMNWQTMSAGGSGTVTNVTAVAPLNVTTGATTPVISLDNSGVTPGTYGSPTQIPVISLDSKGRVMSASSAVLAGIPSGNISNIPSGSISATTVQAAINELDGEIAGKVNKAGDIMTGLLTVSALVSNGNVGIGTNAPAFPLDVLGAANISGPLSVGKLSVPPGSSSVPSLTFSNGTQTGIYSSSVNVIDLVANGVQVMGMSNSGIIANKQFTVQNSTSQPYMASSGSSDFPVSAFGSNFIALNGAFVDNNSVMFGFSGSNVSGNSQKAYMGIATTPGAGTYTPSIVFGQKTGTASYAERMRIDSAGNVGIGTSNPGNNTKLYVYGQIASSSVNVNSSASIDFSAGNSVTTTHNCGSSIAFQNMRDGGNYTLVVTDTGNNQCTFSPTLAGDDSAAVTYRFNPPNGSRTTATHTVYTLRRIQNVVYVDWKSYQ